MMLARNSAAIAEPVPEEIPATGETAPRKTENVKRSRSSAKVEPLALRVLAGFHAGASRSLERRDVLMVGSAADCDVILADEGVGRHHCLITRNVSKLSIRAVDSEVVVGGTHILPGEPMSVETDARIALGDAVLTILTPGAAGDSTPWSAPGLAAEAVASAVLQRWRATPWWGALAIVGLLIAVGVLLFTGARSGRGQDTAATAPHVDAVVQSMGMREVKVKEKADGKMLVQGVVPDQRAATQLRNKLQSEAPQAVVQVRQGDAVADDVSEILRLNGIDATARYDGDGRVEVRGHLGNESALSHAIQSRAMHDIQGLQKVVALNLDNPSPHAVPSGSTAKKIVSINDGPDPYVVTGDGSRYYVGAKLPDGQTLAGVEGNEILLDDGQGVQRKPGVGTRLATK